MSSFKYNQEPRRFRNSESRNTEPNGFHGRTGSSRLEPPKSNQNHHNTVVASVKNGFNNEQELDILINKEPDEICLAEFSEGNGVVVQKNKKNSKQSKQKVLMPNIVCLFGLGIMHSTAKRKLERLQFSTSSSFFKI